MRLKDDCACVLVLLSLQEHEDEVICFRKCTLQTTGFGKSSFCASE
ncbi:hypothetical protein L915_02722 [Phytophthora nicotianae]|uniref:Uncharacterized protein n=1 Tax=Phytophthora nicotianae TaxID=4792 RepID=W2HHY0_PHYNI|nr:hypothetical protein L915_02722 [Phytophthora nicotianae]ETL47570.1 hypothetical protein L916_02698 [Phytophthora nicotianae]